MSTLSGRYNGPKWYNFAIRYRGSNCSSADLVTGKNKIPYSNAIITLSLPLPC